MFKAWDQARLRIHPPTAKPLMELAADRTAKLKIANDVLLEVLPAELVEMVGDAADRQFAAAVVGLGLSASAADSSSVVIGSFST